MTTAWDREVFAWIGKHRTSICSPCKETFTRAVRLLQGRVTWSAGAAMCSAGGRTLFPKIPISNCNSISTRLAETLPASITTHSIPGTWISNTGFRWAGGTTLFGERGTGWSKTISGPGALALVPQRRSLQTFSAFAQDEIALVKDRLHLTLGTKLEHNDYTGFEVQPSARLAWKLSQQQTLWGAISRAIRAPSRIDRDLVVPPVTFGSPDFESEKLRAYELGYRVQPTRATVLFVGGVLQRLQ